jgi:hypothetical protein
VLDSPKPSLPGECLGDPPDRLECERIVLGVGCWDTAERFDRRKSAKGSSDPYSANANHAIMPDETRPYRHVVLTIFKLVTFIRKSSSGCPIEVVLFFSLLAVTAPVTVTVWFMCFARSTVELLSP